MTLETSWMPDDGTWRAVTATGEQALQTIAADPAGVLLVSDFDGTLAPIVPNPLDSRPDEAALAAFAQLGSRLGQVAVVTGREADVARRLGGFERVPGFERLVLLGQYGQEEWDAATGEVRNPETPPGVREALAELESLLAGEIPEAVAGTTLEDKGRGIGVHTRRAADPEQALDWLAGRVDEVAERHGLLLEPGRNVIELRSSSITKGDAINALVERSTPRVVVMMGDDLGDLAAFAALKALPDEVTGICVVAASEEQPIVAEQADVLCGAPAGIAAWLQDVIAALPSSWAPAR